MTAPAAPRLPSTAGEIYDRAYPAGQDAVLRPQMAQRIAALLGARLREQCCPADGKAGRGAA